MSGGRFELEHAGAEDVEAYLLCKSGELEDRETRGALLHVLRRLAEAERRLGAPRGARRLQPAPAGMRRPVADGQRGTP